MVLKLRSSTSLAPDEDIKVSSAVKRTRLDDAFDALLSSYKKNVK